MVNQFGIVLRVDDGKATKIRLSYSKYSLYSGKTKSLKSLSVMLSIIKVMNCLELFATNVMKEDIEGVHFQILMNGMKLAEIIILNLTEIRRTSTRNPKTEYGVIQLLIQTIRFSIDLSVMDIRTLTISIYLGNDKIIMSTTFIALIIHPIIIITFRVITIIIILIVIRHSIRMGSV